MRHRAKHKIIGGIFKLIAFVLLWNWLIPDLFNGPQIGFLQGLGLLMLAHLIFGHKKRGDASEGLFFFLFRFHCYF